jgi:AcrR family transcriptional regulator
VKGADAISTGEGAVRPRARKGEGDKLRDDILDDAETLLAERGHPDAVSVRAIADRVGVSPPAIYLHFADKVELFFACCSRRFAELGEHMEAAAAEETTALGRLEAMGRTYMRFGLERAEQYEVMMLGPIPDSLEINDLSELPGARALSMVAEAVGEGIAAGELHPDLDPEATAVTLWAVCHGTVMVLLSKRGSTVFPMPAEDLVVEHTAGIVRRGLQA